MTYPATRLFLALSGAIGAVIGLCVLFIPHAFFASNNVTLGVDPNLLSEIRAPGGTLLIAGAITIYGAIRTRFLRIALFIGAVLFSSYGVSRLVSLFLDGIPSSTLIGALMIELVFGAIATFLTIKFSAAAPEH